MTFIEKIMAVFGNLKLTDKAKNKQMTAADWEAFRAAYKAEYGAEFATDQQAYQDSQAQQAQTQANAARIEKENSDALGILNQALAQSGSTAGTPEASTGNCEGENPITVSNNSIVAAATQIAAAVTQMAQTPIPDIAPSVSGTAFNINGPGTTADYFCGIEHPLFSMKHRFNQVAVNPRLAAAESIDEQSYNASFRKELKSYASQVGSRMSFLQANNMLNPAAIKAGVSISIAPDGLGDQYLIRRQDQIIARLAAIENVYDIFPRRFGVQDREVMINAFLGDFSQAYQKGHIWKGNIDLKPEVCYVDDAMLKTMFDSMKDIERQYIGYLNREGSDPIKWTMIEWAMLQISTKLIEEQNKRKLRGIFIKPETGKPGHFMTAGTGVCYTLLRYYNEGKMALVDNPAYASYSNGTTMVGVVTNMLTELSEVVEGLAKFEVLLNKNHRAKWIAGVREIYGKDNDFAGPKGDTVPDLGNTIRWVPYLGQLPLIVVQEPGNIQSIELAAGEMHKIKFDNDMEEVIAWSNWKEGTSATYVGKQFETKELRKANGFADQVIFTNRPSVTLDADATTVVVQGDIYHYVTGVNTAATVISDVTGAKAGVAYMVEVGDATFAPTIAKSGKFAKLTAAFTPTKVSDYILLVLNSDGDAFLELERCVGGIRKINTDLQPNVPGGR